MTGRNLLLLCLVPSIVLAQKKPAEIPDGPRGGGTVFSKCGGVFGSSLGGNDRCYEVTVNKLQVQMGSDGTNDDVSVKICSDDKKTCCTTPALKSTFSDDWSKNDLETWGKKYFGPCKDKKFKIKNGLELTLQKKGTDTLGVTSLFVEAETVAKDKTVETERFECGSYTVGGKTSNSSSTKSKFCKTSPYVYERIKVINVTIGNDGTDDSVKVDICSDVNNVCCKTKLSHLLSDDWSKNSVEIWKEGDMGKCKTMQYKVNKANPDGGPRFTLTKNGKDDLIVNKIVMETEDTYGNKFKYDCGDFKLQSQGRPCVPGVNCSQTKSCKKKAIPKLSIGVPRKTTARPRSKTTTRRSSQRIATSTKRTTTRRPFRSGSG